MFAAGDLKIGRRADADNLGSAAETVVAGLAVVDAGSDFGELATDGFVVATLAGTCVVELVVAVETWVVQLDRIVGVGATRARGTGAVGSGQRECHDGGCDQ